MRKIKWIQKGCFHRSIIDTVQIILKLYRRHTQFIKCISHSDSNRYFNVVRNAYYTLPEQLWFLLPLNLDSWIYTTNWSGHCIVPVAFAFQKAPEVFSRRPAQLPSMKSRKQTCFAENSLHKNVSCIRYQDLHSYGTPESAEKWTNSGVSKKKIHKPFSKYFCH